MCQDLRETFSVSGTVLQKVALWCQIGFITAYTAFIVFLHKYVDGFKMDFDQTMVRVLGFVTGLLLVFRTNTAYDRYWEGRKLWSSITHNIRTLIRYVWTTVDEQSSGDAVEKLTIINMLVAFPFALKNYLREDFSYDADNIKYLLKPLPRMGITHKDDPKVPKRGPPGYPNPAFNGDGSGDRVCNGDPVVVNVQSKSPSRSSSIYSSILSRRPRRWRAHAEPTETSIPMEILIYFASYLNKLATQENPVPTTFLNAMNSSLSSLSDAVSGVERILQTPIPVAYAVHLKHTVWLYLLSLPFQLVSDLGWFTIPALTFASFSLLGILHIGQEIENPFGLDDNDLPLDQICERIKREASLTVGRMVRTPSKWIASAENRPLSPFSSMSAVDLSQRRLSELYELLGSKAETESVYSGGSIYQKL